MTLNLCEPLNVISLINVAVKIQKILLFPKTYAKRSH